MGEVTLGLLADEFGGGATDKNLFYVFDRKFCLSAVL